MAAGLNGNLYGTTWQGGPNQSGVIFEYNPANNAYSRKFDFYYTTSGSSPAGAMTLAMNGKFYGLTVSGGDHNKGVLYEYDPVSNVCLRRFDFLYAPTGAEPNGKLTVAADGRLFGTSRGGESDQGILFEYDQVNNQFIKKLEFSEYQKGTYPTGSMLSTSTGKLFGMTATGGNGGGVIFEYDPIGNAINKKFDFIMSSTGGQPEESSLMEASNGKLYGLASDGGANYNGTLFEFDPVNNQFTKRFDFESSSSGCRPKGSLVEGPNHKLYGTASHCGANNKGVLFEYDFVNNNFKKIIDFDGTLTGATPECELLLAPDGLLYGTTDFGGANNHGVLFSYNPTTESFVKRFDFENYSTGYKVTGGLIVGSEGKLFGVTQFGGSYGSGVLYEFNTASNTLTKKMEFSGKNGQAPTGYLTVVKLHQSISFGPLTDRKFGQSSFDLTASVTSGLEIAYTSSNLNVATISGGKISIVGVGNTTISAHQTGNNDYNAASVVSQTLMVNKGDQAITFNPFETMSIAHEPFVLAASTTSGLSITYTSSNETVATVAGNTVTIHSPGTTIITARQAGNSNYSAATDVTQTLTVVTKVDQVITFSSIAAKIFGDTPFTLSATTTSSLPISYTSSDETVATAGSTVTIVGAGTTTITAKQPGNTIYNSAPDVTQTLTVNKANQTITFGAMATKIFGDATFTLSATTTSSLPVSYTSSDETVAIISGNKVTIVGAGSTTIIARQSGNTNYNAATDVVQALTVSKASQTITFPSTSSKTFGDVPFDLTGTSSSGLAIQYSTTSDKISLSGNQVTLIRPGSVAIKADQFGNGNYSAASSLLQTFCINPAKPTITATDLNSGAPVLTSSSSTGNQWYKNGSLLTDAVSNTLSPSTDGSYTVKVSVDNCSSELSSEQILVITGDITSPSVSSFLFYPNPVKDNLSISLSAFDSTSQVEVVIFDVYGKVMEKILKQGEKATVSAVSYSVGTYFIKASQGNRTYFAKFGKE